MGESPSTNDASPSDAAESYARWRDGILSVSQAALATATLEDAYIAGYMAYAAETASKIKEGDEHATDSAGM